MRASGIIKITDYLETLKSPLFSELEESSDKFTLLQKALFPEFSKRWVKDSFHQWSRQYEYPFAAYALERFAGAPSKVLDAGSGITFFPYYLSEKYPDMKIECCDYDPELKSQFVRVNSKLGADIKYFDADIRRIDRADGTYDSVYCISVLEHTADYEEILKEFARLLKTGGILVLTFDISTDGSADIPSDKAQNLLKTTEKYFDAGPGAWAIDPDELDSDAVLTTNYIRKFDKKLLPWKYPRLMFLKSLSKGHVPKHLIRNLACYCGIFKKK